MTRRFSSQTCLLLLLFHHRFRWSSSIHHKGDDKDDRKDDKRGDDDHDEEIFVHDHELNRRNLNDLGSAVLKDETRSIFAGRQIFYALHVESSNAVRKNVSSRWIHRDFIDLCISSIDFNNTRWLDMDITRVLDTRGERDLLSRRESRFWRGKFNDRGVLNNIAGNANKEVDADHLIYRNTGRPRVF